MNSAFFVVHRFSLGAVLCARSTAVSVFVVLAIGLSPPAVGQTSANGAIRGYVRQTFSPLFGPSSGSRQGVSLSAAASFDPCSPQEMELFGSVPSKSWQA